MQKSILCVQGNEILLLQKVNIICDNIQADREIYYEMLIKDKHLASKYKKKIKRSEKVLSKYRKKISRHLSKEKK